MKESGIYALKCPTTGEIRYVGQAKNISARIGQHFRNFKNSKGKGYYGNWIRSLKSEPIPFVLELTKDLDDRERYWIKRLRAEGAKLANTGRGGEGYPKDPVYLLKRKLCTRFGHGSRIAEKMKVIVSGYNDSPDDERESLRSACAVLLEQLESG